MNNIPFYKFFFPISVVMLIGGAAVLFLGFFSVFGFGANFGPSAVQLCTWLLSLGFALFVISWIDLFISRKRTITSSEENIIPQKSHRILKSIGVIIISVVVIFCALIYYIASTMWG